MSVRSRALAYRLVPIANGARAYAARNHVGKHASSRREVNVSLQLGLAVAQRM